MIWWLHHRRPLLWKTHYDIKTSTIQSATDDSVCSVFISYCVCRRLSWTQNTQPNDSSAVAWSQPNDSSAVAWLSFWCSTRLTRKKLVHSFGSYLYSRVLKKLGVSTPRRPPLPLLHFSSGLSRVETPKVTRIFGAPLTTNNPAKICKFVISLSTPQTYHKVLTTNLE